MLPKGFPNSDMVNRLARKSPYQPVQQSDWPKPGSVFYQGDQQLDPMRPASGFAPGSQGQQQASGIHPDPPFQYTTVGSGYTQKDVQGTLEITIGG